MALLNNIEKLKSIMRVEIQRTVPLLYSEDLTIVQLIARLLYQIQSYNEKLDEVIDLTSLQNIIIEEIYDYVNNYFANLDITKEVTDKLDQMAKDGTLSAIIKEIVYQNSSPIFVENVSDMSDTNKIYVLSSTGDIYYYNGNGFVNSGLQFATNLDDYFGYKGVLTSADNCNDLDLKGYYVYGSNSTPENSFSNRGGIILNLPNDNGYINYQIGMENRTNILFKREYNGSSWSNWDDKYTFLMNSTISPSKYPNLDLNELDQNGAYFLSTSNTYSNAPFESGCILQLYDPSYDTRQYQIGINYTNSNLYFRNKKSANSWSSWSNLADSVYFANNGTLTDGADLNNIDKSGIYFISSSRTYINSPIESGLLVNINGGTNVRQYQVAYDYSTGTVYRRNSRGENKWSVWESSSKSNSSKTYSFDGTKYNFKYGDITFTLIRRVDASTNQDIWGLGNVSYKNKTITTGDIEGPIYQRGDDDFIGGVHGYEKTLNIDVLIDGVKHNMSDVVQGDFSECNIYIYSELYTRNTSDVACHRYVQITMVDDIVKIRNNYIFDKVFECTRATSGGLFAVYDSYINYISDDIDYISYPGPSGTTNEVIRASTERKELTFNCNGFTITVKNNSYSPTGKYYSWIQHFATESTPRTKLYMDVINSNVNGYYTFQIGDNLKSDFEIKVNSK